LGAVPAFAAAAPAIDADDIGGVVSGPKGPEAGVWVIAEAPKVLPTPMIKIVVTDDQGRYVLPDLPKGKYKIWVRGYGIQDSKPVEGEVGKTINLTVQSANAKQAAEVYPANYWEALIKIPEESEFPGTGPSGNGINPGFARQQEWMGHFKEQCHFCHQQGTRVTRNLDAPDHVEAWDQRIQKARGDDDPEFGPHGKEFAGTMINNMTRFGKQRGLNMWADWTKSIAAGALPPEAPPRPAGAERNVVITMWDFAGGHFVHDEVTSDKRNPEINANGPVYGVDTLLSNLSILEPSTGKVEDIPVPGMTPENAKQISRNSLSVHNPMIGSDGRVWMTMLMGEGAPLDYCEDGPNATAFGKYYPNGFKSTRRISVYDPKTKKISLIPVCFSTHHINFGHDKDNTLFFSGDSNVLGWLNTKVWDETHDPKKAEGWCPWVVDTNGDGKIDPNHKNWNEPENNMPQLKDPKKDTRLSGFPYGMNVSPVDDSVWFANFRPHVPSSLVRLERGSNPPETCKAEYYEPPKGKDGNYLAYNARGVDIDSKGIAWVAFGSGQLGRFDRSKCKHMKGPESLGQGCVDGWTLYDAPGPKISNQKIGTADWHYLAWVDLHGVLGLGKDVPILPGDNSDSLLALNPDTGKWTVLRVPYPQGFFPRGMDARVDDPKAGWKGKGVWANYGELPIFHQEDGEGAYSKMVKFQVRPDPLAH
jgi:hypothetical protein